MANRRRYSDEQLVVAVGKARCWADVMEDLGFPRNRSAQNVKAVALRLQLDSRHLDGLVGKPTIFTGYGEVENTSTVGTRTEGIVLAALIRVGKTILLPFGSGHRYDLAVDDGGRLLRIQCKTAVLRNGRVDFKTASQRRDGTQVGYAGDADAFGVHCPEIDKVYLVPVDHVGSTRGYLWVDQPGNTRASGVRFARDYEFG